MVALVAVGGIVMLVGGIMIIIKAFQESIVWGLASLFIPIVGLVFVLTHWDDAGKPFLIYLAGLALYIVGIVAVGGSAGG